MSYYAIAVGGTGARCLEGLIHLCAMGLGPKKLFILFLDPDEAHYSINRSKALIARYLQCKEYMGLAGTSAPEPRRSSSLFRTELILANNPNSNASIYTWSPLEEHRTLREYFEYLKMPREYQDLCKLLYSEKELDLEWDQGFRGRASIGAPVMANIAEKLGEPPWYNLVENMKQALNVGPAKLMIFATIFGATGASGFPAIAEILRSVSEGNQEGDAGWPNKNRFRIGGALLLPYFAYNIPPEMEKNKDIYARPQDFMINAKTALSHYHFRWGKKPPYDKIYLIGDQTLDTEGREFGPGGEKQRNGTHYIELLASLAALDFYDMQDAENKEPVQCIAGREGAEPDDFKLRWEDIPYQDLKDEVLGFASLSLAYLAFYQPLINDSSFEHLHFLIPWEAEHFKRGELRSAEVLSELQAFQQYFISYLEWLCEIHLSTSRDLMLLDKDKMRAIQQELKRERPSIADNVLKALLNRAAYQYNPRKYGYDAVWEEMCKIRYGEVSSSEKASGRFLTLLHAAIKRFCANNYRLKEE